MQRSYYPSSRNRTERSKLRDNLPIILALFFIAAGLIGYTIDAKSKNRVIPIAGGTYTEGVVADSPTKEDQIIARLTNIGLTYQDSNGEIKPALADSWEASEDHKNYTFHVHPGYDATGLLSIIQNSKTAWSGVTITAPDASTLQFALNNPIPLFLPSTTVPLFPYGPYQLVKREKETTTLRANTDFVLGSPYIQKILIKTFDSPAKLVAAARDGEVNGTADFTLNGQVDKNDIPKSFAEKTLKLPRFYVLFFNITRPGLAKVAERERIIQGMDGVPVTYTLLTSQTGYSSELAQTLAKELASKHITLNLQKRPGAVLQREDIAKREFDLLLYGINYGVDDDYYPFWHSSQATANGLNIDGVKDKALDSLLDQARQTTNLGDRQAVNKQIDNYLAGQALQKIMSQDEASYWMDSTVKGVKYGTIEEANDRFSLAWEWYIKTKKVR